MKQIGKIIAVMAVAFGLAQSAIASTLNSSYIYAFGSESVYCNAVNVSTSPITSVTVDLINNAGTVTATNTCPGLAADGTCGAGPGPGIPARCRITITGGKTRLRGLFELDDPAGNAKFGVPIN